MGSRQARRRRTAPHAPQPTQRCPAANRKRSTRLGNGIRHQLDNRQHISRHPEPERLHALRRVPAGAGTQSADHRPTELRDHRPIRRHRHELRRRILPRRRAAVGAVRPAGGGPASRWPGREGGVFLRGVRVRHLPIRNQHRWECDIGRHRPFRVVSQVPQH